MKKINLIAIVMVFLLSACSSDDDSALGVNLRINNISQFNLTEVNLNASTNSTNVVINLPELGVGQQTDYFNFSEVYPHPWATIEVEGEILTWHGNPISEDAFFLEGNFTCFIDVVRNENQENTLLVFLMSDD